MAADFGHFNRFYVKKIILTNFQVQILYKKRIKWTKKKDLSKLIQYETRKISSIWKLPNGSYSPASPL